MSKKTITKNWNELGEKFSGLSTDEENVILAQREAIPLIFVPGVMGSVLRLAGTNGEGDGDDGLPNLRWEPGDSVWMLKTYFNASPAFRRRMLIGESGRPFNPDFLEVHNSTPVGDGFQGVSRATYHDFLNVLKQSSNWGPLNKLFEFPVYAFGYNWSDTNFNNGKKLANRIDEIINEAKEVVGKCDQVILLTHSMGGLVSRSASELHGAKSKILGIVHGVQPVTGSAAAFWRVKAGFEAHGLVGGISARVLGNSGDKVTPILGNIPGGLELLPNQLYRDNDGNSDWLQIIEGKKATVSLPKSDPYSEIYRVKSIGKEIKGKPDHHFWSLIDENLLDPELSSAEDPAPDSLDALESALRPSSWNQYLKVLAQAESFQKAIGDKCHPSTYTFHGVGHASSDRIEYVMENYWVDRDAYRNGGFWGRLVPGQGKLRGVLQSPDGDGDGTVPVSSATELNQLAQKRAAPFEINVEHEPAYKNTRVQRFAINAILDMCQKKLKENI